MSVKIDVEHLVPHVHTQNGLAEAFIKRLQMIARTLVMRTKLPVSAWGYAILHAAMLVRLRPIATQPHSPLQLVTGYEPNVSHLRGVWVHYLGANSAAATYQNGSSEKIGIYIGYDSP